jgi:hypothetical protein
VWVGRRECVPVVAVQLMKLETRAPSSGFLYTCASKRVCRGVKVDSQDGLQLL